MKSQHSELFYYAMAVYGIAALAIAAFPSATKVEVIANADSPTHHALAKSELTKFAGTPLISSQADF